MRYSSTFRGAYAYVAAQGLGNEKTLAVINISNPASPSFASRYELAASGWAFYRDMTIRGKYLYLTWEGHATGGAYISVFDISEPADLVLMETFTIPGTTNTNIRDHVIVGDYMYAMDTGTNEDDVMIFNISDPGNISYVGEFGDDIAPYYMDGPWGIAYAKNTLFIAVSSDDNVVMFDITDPESPVLLGSPTDADNLPPTDGAKRLTVIGNRLLVSTAEASSAANEGLSIFTIGGLDTPSVTAGNIKADELDVIGDSNLDDVFISGGLTVDGSMTVDTFFANTGTISEDLTVVGNLYLTNVGTNSFTGPIFIDTDAQRVITFSLLRWRWDADDVGEHSRCWQ